MSALEPGAAPSDEERRHVIQALSEACAAGRLTLGDFSRQAARALHAMTRSELDAMSRELSGSLQLPEEKPHNAHHLERGRHGDGKRSGRWRLSSNSYAVAVMGTCMMDLRGAELESQEVTLTAYSVMGTVKLLVPEGVQVALDGISVMGKREFESSSPPFPGAPVIRLTGLDLMGSTEVKTSGW